MTGTYERLMEEIQAQVIEAYQHESMLGLFPSFMGADISLEQFVMKVLDDLPDAAVHAAGYNPSQGTLNLREFGLAIYTADEEIKLSERDWAFAQKHGTATMGLAHLGKKIGEAATKYLWTGLNMDDVAVESARQYNFIIDAGSGVVNRPTITTNATCGKWDVWADINEDINTLLGDLVAKDYNLESTVVYYPKVASKLMHYHSAAFREASALELLNEWGINGTVAVPNHYMRTAAGATPTAEAWDLYAIDMSQIKIGYTRPERAMVVPGTGADRNHYLQGEVWFCPIFQPRNIDGTYYKGVSRITAIDATT